jgi:hypothetical protein
MSLFSKILDKLGLRKEQPTIVGTTDVVHPTPRTETPDTKRVEDASPTGAAPTSEKGIRARTPGVADKRQEAGVSVRENPSPVPATPTVPRAVSQVDVMHILEQKAQGTGLNWKQSISDLLFLLDIDNSRQAREELAQELGAPADVMSDNVRMNLWLHKEVLRKIAENGGNIPQDLLD